MANPLFPVGVQTIRTYRNLDPGHFGMLHRLV